LRHDRLMELWGLFVAAFAAATILPLASEIPLALVVSRSGDPWWPVAVATLGNYLGACTTYGLARAAAATLEPRLPEHRPCALKWFQRYGPLSLLLSWVPLAGDGIVVLAGAARIPFLTFSVWTALGKAARYLVVASTVLDVR
jgi:membrane protein YqaA with SNARE-associated domain